MVATVSVIGAGTLSAEFVSWAHLVDVQVERVVRTNGQLLLTRVKANASGRPGPNAPTGDYRRSISLRVVRGKGLVIATVGTNRPQGRRLEYGFHGVDSLGRHYNQPPYPHFGPAVDLVQPAFFAEMERIGPK